MIKPEVFEDKTSLYVAAAEYFVQCYETAIGTHNAFHVALSGGSTPKNLYRLLTSAPYADKINWGLVHFYFGDERFVSHDSDESNFKMAKQALLDNVACPAQNIHPVNTALDSADLAAAAYENTLHASLPQVNQQSVFDLVLLGLGADGHTASLFPDTDILDINNKDCAAVFVEKMNNWRVSITFPTINRAQHILLLAESVTKADIVKSIIEWDKPTPNYPVQRIAPGHKMRWYIDRAAAMFI